MDEQIWTGKTVEQQFAWFVGKSALEDSDHRWNGWNSFFKKGIWQGFGIPVHLGKVVDGVRFLVHLHRHKFEAACSLFWIQQRRSGSARKKDENMSARTSTLWYSSILVIQRKIIEHPTVVWSIFCWTMGICIAISVWRITSDWRLRTGYDMIWPPTVHSTHHKDSDMVWVILVFVHLAFWYIGHPRIHLPSSVAATDICVSISDRCCLWFGSASAGPGFTRKRWKVVDGVSLAWLVLKRIVM